jgi:DNA ligase-1
MMEKYDGVRVFWNGNSLFTKDMKLIITPPRWTRNFPSFAFEGELYCGPNNVQNAIDLASGRITDWSSASIQVFDAPLAIMRSFSDRLELLTKSIYTY